MADVPQPSLTQLAMFECMKIGGNPNINEPICCLGHASAHTDTHEYPYFTAKGASVSSECCI